MTSIQLFACIGMVTGFFILLRLSPMEFTDGVFRSLTSRPKSLKDEINELTHRKKKSFLRREIADTQNILKMTGREPKFPAICAMSLLLFVVGASAAIMMGNFFLVPVMAVGMMFVPFWFIKLTASYYKKNIAAELETALSIITTAYLRNEDIQTAVEENLEYLNPPVKSVFAEFLARIQLVDPDVSVDSIQCACCYAVCSSSASADSREARYSLCLWMISRMTSRCALSGIIFS